MQTQYGAQARQTLLKVHEVEQDVFYGGNNIEDALNVTKGDRGISRFGEPEVVELYQIFLEHIDMMFFINYMFN